jgi:triphosphoribosyl-dephospho-CoA synthase
MTDALAQTIELNVIRACVAEVCAPKAGNVHLGAEFEDAQWSDFVASASAIGPVLARANRIGVGQAVLEAVQATQQVAESNTNLGMILLLAPLCASSQAQDLRSGVQHVLDGLTDADAAGVYDAIQLVNPGGLGRVGTGDVSQTGESMDTTPPSLVDSMRLAEDRDDVAKQYATGFADVFDFIAPGLAMGVNQGMALDQVIVRMHLELIAKGDSLIARKCGQAIADEAAARAKTVCDAGWPGGGKSGEQATRLFEEFDDWLRDDGNRRNPGTSADLIVAGLYVAFQQGMIAWPAPWQGELVDWSCVV